MKIDTRRLDETISKIFAEGKGILAADESNNSTAKRLDLIELENTEENRRRFRDLLLSAEEYEDYISGVILYDETFWQKSLAGIPFTSVLEGKGVIPGIKVDRGLVELPGSEDEEFTQGLDDLDARMERYAAAGAGFAKWRAVFKIDTKKGLPSFNHIRLTSNTFALYAAICQRNGVVPIIEPEVLMDGSYTTAEKRTVMEAIFRDIFFILKKYDVYLPGVILKSSFVHMGSDSGEYLPMEDIYKANSEVFENHVPKEVGGIVFLSGGLSSETALDYLNGTSKMMSRELEDKSTFSFARSIQIEPLMVWAGKDENIPAARAKFIEILALNSKAQEGGL